MARHMQHRHMLYTMACQALNVKGHWAHSTHTATQKCYTWHESYKAHTDTEESHTHVCVCKAAVSRSAGAGRRQVGKAVGVGKTHRFLKSAKV